jgi:hypothetical protein
VRCLAIKWTEEETVSSARYRANVLKHIRKTYTIRQIGQIMEHYQAECLNKLTDEQIRDFAEKEKQKYEQSNSHWKTHKGS